MLQLPKPLANLLKAGVLVATFIGGNFVFASAAHASENAAVSKAHLSLASELFEISGLEQMVNAVPEATRSSFEEALASRMVPGLMAELEPSALLSAVSTAFNAKDLSRTIEQSIAQSMSQVQLDALVQWYQSPLGLRVVAAETQQSQLLYPEKFIEFQQQLSLKPPTEERIEAIRRLDEAMSVTTSAVEAMLNMQMAFTLSIMKALPEDKQVPADVIIAQSEAQRPLLEAHYRDLSRDSMLFTYQDFSIEELHELGSIMREPAGGQFVDAINKGLEKGIFDASATLGELIVQLHHYQQSSI
ncbi:MAG: DUF2059 domain-containing protein [Gammaproteobacteria bacterium]|nr:DUF2059 domain-containing protein [Gammaproteobacteria bacterium]